ncbi:hypothetical protein AAJ76_1130004427 [Vairimorpha ceranae]|uniref:Uncharacterized protein n=1 Tax=Vairimorpha ceranae TaxID=40302 RepID=A0A0F9W8V4_9MICR|nr:hypothetical protein AAJ76_1130004427 [Vairimorpha ceranae]KKO74131.1 hypothetical protein AAJ76_1130004427 [Vairimorpha ceranae]
MSKKVRAGNKRAEFDRLVGKEKKCNDESKVKNNQKVLPNNITLIQSQPKLPRPGKSNVGGKPALDLARYFIRNEVKVENIRERGNNFIEID